MGTITKLGIDVNYKVLCVNADRTAFRIPGRTYTDESPWEIVEGETYEVVEMYTVRRYDDDGKYYDTAPVYLLKHPKRDVTFTDSNTQEVVPFGFHARRFKIIG